MTVAAPFINPEDLLKRSTRTPKELLEDRLAKKLAQHEAVIKDAKRVFDQRETDMKKFLAEVENCFSEDDVKRLCSNQGV